MKVFQKIIVLVAVLLYGTGHLVAQQDALYSQYMFDPFTINPAVAGSKSATSAVLLYRNQWVGFEGAPNTQSFSIHSPFRDKNFALGLNVFNDNIGPTNNMGAFATYAYHLPLGKGRLSMGLRGGAYNTNFDVNQLEYREPDANANDGGVNSLVPSFDFGLYYYTNQFYVGLSSTHLTQQELGFESATNGVAGLQLRRHFLLSSGVAIELNDNLLFRPSGLVKYVDGAPLNVDINTSFLIKEVLWLGVSFRTSRSLVFISEVNITDYLRAGYSYDMGFNELQDHHGGTHEIFVGVDFNISRTKSISPRYR